MGDWLETLMMVLMYLAGFTLIIYGILKGLGIINTPLMVLAIPYIVGGISIVGAVFYFVKMVNYF
ncbi:MAG: hypothetical protein KJ592_03830 [Nanoarchaeota archaeon]|nr:hypothetical protein [Nanoarchaeota archaeon]